LNLHKKDSITVEKGGEIIPNILSSSQNGLGEKFAPPSSCPSCAEEVYKEEKYLKCLNPTCPAKLKRRLEFACSRSVLNINIELPTIIKLVDGLEITKLSEFFSMTQEEISKIIKGEVLPVKIFKSIQSAKNVDLDKFILMLGMPRIGINDIRRLLDVFGTLNGIIQAVPDMLLAVPGIGEKKAFVIHEFFDDDRIDEIIKLSKIFKIKRYETKPMLGVTVVLTGKLPIDRPKLRELLSEIGVKVTNSVSKNTDYLVIGEGGGVKKIEKAKELSIKTLTYEEFKEAIKRLGGKIL